ncbi:hypothetical protein SAMN05216210_0259 [Halopseudomonas salegens]|uniref:Uncharacterized protein n=1 Tax=Halopseudomonas salegens TaxID=1434072 RepID=A0A1H2E2W2_9GAMM|nr:hypothetical protein SAMN05216210_0259 [Halopseudomonas salegens]
MTDKAPDRPAGYRVSADRRSASRRVRYVEGNRQDPGECRLCQLDELAEGEATPGDTQDGGSSTRPQGSSATRAG